VNYFNYFTEVEDTFVRRRAKHLFLSPLDWALIESWKEMGIPLHLVLRGIEKAFDSWEAKPRKRSVKSLLYCQEEVEAQYAEWLESRVGASLSEDGNDEQAIAVEAADAATPFSRAALIEHLGNARTQLSQTWAQRQAIAADDLCESLARAVNLLADLEAECLAVARPNAQALEHSLSGVERMLTDAVRAAGEEAQVAEITKEIKHQLRPYRSHMEPAVYEQTVDNFVLKRLREQFGVPRLSLFYL
jgi:hypothetical protein